MRDPLPLIIPPSLLPVRPPSRSGYWSGYCLTPYSAPPSFFSPPSLDDTAVSNRGKVPSGVRLST